MFKQVCRILVLAIALGAAPAAMAEFKCPKLSGFFGVKLTVKDYHIGLSSLFSNDNKRAICASFEESIKILIDNPSSSDFQIEPGDVTVVQKTGSHILISGSNANNKKYLEISIDKPVSGFDPTELGECDDGTEGCAGFDIVVAGLGKLDPRVRVVDNNLFLFNKLETVQEVFEDLDLTLDEVNMLFDQFRTELE